MVDPITDMLNRIRNAQAVGHPTAEIPYSDLKYEIAKIMEKEKFVGKVEKKGKKTKKSLEITFEYEDKIPVISGLRRVSKPGQRVYLPSKKLRPVKGGYGIAIVSTSRGLMTNKQARKQKLGGEIICEVW